MEKYVEGIIYPMDLPRSQSLRKKHAEDTHRNVVIRDHLERAFGGGWMYNEIVGYIRLHFLGSQVRGEYIGVKKKRVVRARTKTFEFHTWKLAPEVEIPRPRTNEGVFRAVLEYLSACGACQ